MIRMLWRYVTNNNVIAIGSIMPTVVQLMFIKVCIWYATRGTCNGQHLFVHIHMLVQQQQRATSQQTLKAYARMSSVLSESLKNVEYSQQWFSIPWHQWLWKQNCYMLLSKQFHVGCDGMQQPTCSSWTSHRGQRPLVGWTKGKWWICKLGVG